MKIRRIVPDLETERLEESRDFYTNLIGLRVAMDLGWILTLQSPTSETAQLNLMTHDATAPVVPDISIEVADVDAVHAEALRRGEKIVHPCRTSRGASAASLSRIRMGSSSTS